MMSRLLISVQSVKFCTELLCGTALLFCSVGAHAQTYKSNAFYEIMVVESLPEDMTLDMSLKEITGVKDTSRAGETKKNIYAFLDQTLSPLLNEYAAGDNKSLIELAAKLPVADLLEGLSDVNNGKTDPSKVTPADFMIVILPKLSESENLSLGTAATSALYSKNKASVIDVRGGKKRELLMSHEEIINAKLKATIKYMYTRNFVKLSSKEPFFVGALFNVHINGDKTSIKTQLVGSLPTDIKEVFENVNDQVHLKHAHSPKSPTEQSIKNNEDFPGVVVEFVHKPRQKNLMKLSVKFGSLGLIKNKSWKVKNELQKIEETWIDKKLGLGLDFTSHFNLPHLTGSLQAPKLEMTQEELEESNKAGVLKLNELNSALNNNEIDFRTVAEGMSPYLKEEPSFGGKAAAKATAIAASLYNIQINVHEVYVNVNTVEVERIRVSLKLKPKGKAPNLPAVEMESVNGQFTEEGNKALAPVREKLQSVLGKSPEQLLNDPKIQREILKFVLKFMQSKQVKTVGGVK